MSWTQEEHLYTQGIQGNQSNQGNQGQQGNQGNQGNQDIMGNQGNQCNFGDQGNLNYHASNLLVTQIYHNCDDLVKLDRDSR